MAESKRFAINVLARTLSFLVNIGMGLILAPYIVKNIGKEAYGFIGLANNFTSYAQVTVIALNSLAARFVSICIYRGEEKEANKYFSSTFFSNVLLSLFLGIVSAIIISFLEKLINIPPELYSDVKLLFGFIFLGFLCNVLFSVYDIAAFTQNRLDLSSLRTIASNILRVVVLVSLFVLFVPNVWYVGFSFFIASVFIAISNMKLSKHLLPTLSLSLSLWDVSKVKELVKSGIWNSITQLSNVFSFGLDLLIANLFIGASAMGILSLSKLMPTYIASLFSMLGAIFIPNLTKAYAQNDFLTMKEQLLFSMKFFSFLSSIPIVILISFGDLFYKLWLPGEDYFLIYVLSIIASIELCFALPLQGIWNIFTVVNRLRLSSLLLLLRGILTFSIIMLAMNFASSSHKIYFLSGISSLLGILNVFVFLPIYGAKCINQKWSIFYPYVIKSLITVSAVVFISFLIKRLFDFHTWVDLFGGILFSLSLIVAINYTLIFDREDRNRILKICNSYMRKE